MFCLLLLHWATSDAQALVAAVTDLQLSYQIQVKSHQSAIRSRCHCQWTTTPEDKQTFHHYTLFFFFFQAVTFPCARNVCRCLCYVWSLMCWGGPLGQRVSWQSLAGQSLAFSCYFCLSHPLHSFVFVWEAVGNISKVQWGRECCSFSWRVVGALQAPKLSCRWEGTRLLPGQRHSLSLNAFVGLFVTFVLVLLQSCSLIAPGKASLQNYRLWKGSWWCHSMRY